MVAVTFRYLVINFARQMNTVTYFLSRMNSTQRFVVMIRSFSSRSVESVMKCAIRLVWKTCDRLVYSSRCGLGQSPIGVRCLLSGCPFVYTLPDKAGNCQLDRDIFTPIISSSINYAGNPSLNDLAWGHNRRSR